MKKYLNKGTPSEMIVTVISVYGEKTIIQYSNGEIGEVPSCQLSEHVEET